MDQVSRPLLIAFAATVALVAVWLVALRPKPVAIDNTPLAPTQEIAKARNAVAISDAANRKALAAAGNAGSGGIPAAAGSPAQPAAKAPAAAAAPSAAAKAPSATAPKSAAGPAKAAKHAARSPRDAAIMRAVAHGKVVVLLFWNAKTADDIATRGVLRDLNRHHGKVVVKVVPITDVAHYPSVTRGVKIAGSPTTVVIGHKGRAHVIAGLAEPHELAHAVGDALAGR